MSKWSKEFSNLVVTDIELQELFNHKNIDNVRIGRLLEASLLANENYNERLKTLFNHPITWIEGNDIVVQSSHVKKDYIYKTINSKPADYSDLVTASAIISADRKQNISLTEAFGLAVKALLINLGVKDGKLFD